MTSSYAIQSVALLQNIINDDIYGLLSSAASMYKISMTNIMCTLEIYDNDNIIIPTYILIIIPLYIIISMVQMVHDHVRIGKRRSFLLIIIPICTFLSAWHEQALSTDAVPLLTTRDNNALYSLSMTVRAGIAIKVDCIRK